MKNFGESSKSVPLYLPTIRKKLNDWKIASNLGVDHGNLYLPLMDQSQQESSLRNHFHLEKSL